jgi:hypothetical protein
MTDKVPLVLPTLADIERIYIVHVLEISETLDIAAGYLGVTTNTLYNKIKKHEIAHRRRPGRKSPPMKVNKRNTGKVPPSLMIRQENGRDMSVWVVPAERDYYYNLDFLCGTYKDLKTHGLTPDPELD